jgi:HEAT repeat protein
LLSVLQFIAISWFLPALTVTLAIAYVASALIIRQQYGRALIAMLEQEDFSFLLAQEASDLVVTDPAALNSLRKRLEESTSPEFTIFMAQLISQIGSQEAISILDQAAKETTDARVRAAILEVLTAADVQGQAVYQLYTDFLADPAGPVRQAALAGLEQMAGPADERFLSVALAMLADPEIEVRVRVLPPLLRSNNPAYTAPANQALNELLISQNIHERARAVHALGQTGDVNLIDRLIPHLADPADEVRLEAAVATEALSKNKIFPEMAELILPQISQLVRDPVERTRQVALVIVQRLAARDAYPVLVSALTDTSPQVRAIAVDALVQAGKSVIPTVHPQLDSHDPQLRKMATVTLSRINREQFGSLIEAHITGNLLAIYRSWGRLVALSPYAEYAGITVLQSTLREQNQQLIDEIFYLLTAVYHPRDVKIVVEALESEDARVRANAIEALEALTAPHTARLITPLFEPELSPAQLLEVSQEAWDMIQPDPITVIKQVITDPNDSWLRAFVTFALGEIGATLAPRKTPNGSNEVSTASSDESPIDQTIGQSKEPSATDGTASEEHSAPRRHSSNLFNVLDGLGEANQQLDKPTQPEPKARRPRPADLLGALIGPDQADKQADERSQVEERGFLPRPANLLGALTDALEEVLPQANQKAAPPVAGQPMLALAEIENLLDDAFADRMIDVRLAARAAKRMITGQYAAALVTEEGILLSAVEKIIFLKEVPFFQGMTVDQLKVLANVCEEELFEEDSRIFNQGDPGGALYVVVSGRVGIEQEKRKGSFVRLANVEAHSYFGEMNLFDNSPRSATAIALQDTLILRLRREPLIALARQYPDLSLELINVLSERLREANDRIADLTRTRTRELQKFYDKFD